MAGDQWFKSTFTVVPETMILTQPQPVISWSFLGTSVWFFFCIIILSADLILGCCVPLRSFFGSREGMVIHLTSRTFEYQLNILDNSLLGSVAK